MSCRTRRARSRAIPLAICTIVALTAGIGALSRSAIADAQSCNLNIGGLEIDGNLVSDSAGQLDWFLPTSGGSAGDGFLQRSPTCGVAYPDAIFDPARIKTLTIHNMVRDDCNAQGNKDSSVFGSTSDKNNSCLVLGLAPWNCKSGDIPQKNDLTEAYAAVWQDKRTLVNGAPNPTLNHLFLGIAVGHRSTDGDNHIDFEYNQQGLSDCINGVIVGPPATNATGGRTVGDFVVSVDFTGGGNTGGVSVHLWGPDAAASCGYSYGSPVSGGLGLLGAACENGDAATDPHNKTDVTVEAPCSAWQPTSSCVLGGLYHENQFIEAAVDLDVAGITNNLVCGSNSTLIIKSRSSQEFTAELKDFLKFPFQILKPPVLAPTGGTACAGGSVQLCANVTGGTTPIGITWSGGAGTTDCVTVTPASTTTYTVTVTDAEGCTVTGTATATINPNPTVSVTNVCAGAQLCATGTAPTGATISGYSWSTGATSQCITPGAGTYSVTVTDSRGCTGSNTGTVYPNPTVSVTNVCAGAQLCANGTAPTGATISGYSWSTGATSQCITPAAGTYTVTVTDSRGCTGSNTGTVYPNPTVSVTNVCSGAQLCATGTAPTGATISGYSWSTGSTDQCITPAVGTYTVTVTDSRGCTGSNTGTVYDLPTVSVNSGTFCPTSGTLQLCATATAPTGATIASYAWNTGATTQCINASAAGTYSVTVTDSRGCTASGFGTATESCPNGCTPGFWCGGVGIKMWNTNNDPQWPGPATSCGGHNPFKQSDLFTSFFASTPSVVGKTMTDLLCTGGGSDPAQKAARDVIAACLNGCSGLGYPYTCDQIKTLWSGALDGTGPYNLDQLHVLLAAANQAGCPFGQVQPVATAEQGVNDGAPAATQTPAPTPPGSDLDGVALYRPIPNPFATSTRVVYAVPSGGMGVDIGVYDLAGRRIRTLVSGSMSQGRHSTSWDGMNSDGVRVKDGMYFIHTVIAGQRRTISVVLLK